MTKRIQLQPAYVLHRRVYRESSLLLELFSQDHGRFSAVAKGVRKKNGTAGLLQAFTPLLISCSGKGELQLLTHAEPNGEIKKLSADSLYAGFYLNELLMCLTEKWDAHAGLFQAYANSIDDLASSLQQQTLRRFEKYLLEEIGYGLMPSNPRATFVAENYYRFIPEQGFQLSTMGDDVNTKTNIFLGKNLLAIASEDWENIDALQDAKRLTRLALSPLLGARPIYSRSLFLQPDLGKRGVDEE